MSNKKYILLKLNYLLILAIFNFPIVYAGNATSSGNTAQQMQKKADSLKLLTPKPLSGWKAEDVDSNAVEGIGIRVSRSYSKGNNNLSVVFVADSQSIQTMASMLSNPAYYNATGGKVLKVNGQDTIITYDPNIKAGKIEAVIDNRYLITVNGENVQKADLTGYAKTIDFKKIASLH